MNPLASGLCTVTGTEIAASIGPGLLKAAMVMVVDGVQQDLSESISADASLRFITRRDPEALDIIRHDAAHVLAEAVQELAVFLSPEGESLYKGWREGPLGGAATHALDRAAPRTAQGWFEQAGAAFCELVKNKEDGNQFPASFVKALQSAPRRPARESPLARFFVLPSALNSRPPALPKNRRR